MNYGVIFVVFSETRSINIPRTQLQAERKVRAASSELSAHGLL